MAAVKAGIILIWTGTNAAIPSGWERETSLDGKYPKASGAEAPNTTGGSNTHTHTATAHGHTMNAHTHDVPLQAWSGPSSAENISGDSADNLGHNSAAIGGTSGGSLASEAETWSSPSGDESEPPYKDVIFIKPSAAASPVADDICLFWNDATAPTNFNHCDGGNGTTDLRTKHLKGAATAGDAGGTGGATTHEHTITHNHAATGHTHSGNSANYSASTRGGGLGPAAATSTHRHVISLNSTSAGAGNYTNAAAGGADTSEVLHKKLAVIQNTKGSSVGIPKGAIALWLGSVANIPSNWLICDGTLDTPNLTDYFIKVITVTGDIGNTAGSNTHTHTAVSHGHTATGTHTHTGSTGGPNATNDVGGGGDGYSSNTHTHTLTSISSPTATWANTDMDSGSATNNEPAYRTAAFIQFQGNPGGGILGALV